MRIKKSVIGMYLLLASATSTSYSGTTIQAGQEFTINLSGGLISATGGAATDISCWQGGTFMQNGNVMSSLTVPFVSGSGIMYDISSGAPTQIGSYNSTCSYTLTPSSSAPSVINGVANGVALTDAVNLDQLNAVASGANNYANTVGTNALTSANGYTNSQITGLGTKTNGSLSSVSASFGSGSTYNPVTGVFTQPTYTVKGTSYNNVGSALNALNAASSSSTNNLGTSTAQSLGSGATYDPTTGSISAPTYSIGGTAYNNVGGALTATDNKADKLGSSTAQNIGGGATYDAVTGNISAPTIQAAGLTHNNTTDAIQALDKAAVQYDKNPDGSVNTDNVTMQGVNGTTIHNVAAGVVGTDAANVQQVTDAQNNAITTSKNYTDITASGLTANANTTGADVAAHLGGNAVYDPTTGKISAPSYSIGGTAYNNVGGALTATDTKADKLGNSTAQNIGGGATYDAVTGNISAPTIQAAGLTHNNTTDAVQALDKAAVQYDKNPDGSVNTDNVTMQGVNGTTIHNVTAGTLGTDAANVQQVSNLTANTNTSGADTAAHLGAGSTYDPTTGIISAPTYSIGGTNYSNVGSALTATDTKADNLGSTTAQSIGGSATYDAATGNISAPTIQAAGLTHNNTTNAIQALDKAAVQYDKNPDGSVNTDNVTMQGVNGTTIHNVTAGVVGTDAANVQQVTDSQNNAINTANVYTDKQLNSLDTKTQAQIASLGSQNQQQFKALNNAMKANSSVAAAMTGLVPNYMSKSKSQVQAAVGYGAGAVGVAAGTTYQLTNDILLVGKLGVSTTGNTGFQNRVGGAVGISFGL